MLRAGFGWVALVLVWVMATPAIAGTSPVANKRAIAAQTDRLRAAHFLSLATFGPSLADIDALAGHMDQVGSIAAMEEWIDDQFALPATLHEPLALAMMSDDGVGPTVSGGNQNRYRDYAFFHTAIAAPDQLRQRMAWALVFNEATRSVELSTVFPSTALGTRLEMVARAIGARAELGQSRQLFFVERGGWDHHDEVLNAQALVLPEVSAALGAFYAATEELGVAADVVTYSISDFARTLSSNGNGSDHGWGGNHLVMGGSAVGGDVYGAYPESLALGNDLDLGRGRLLPTTSVDEYNAELVRWFGVPNDGNLETILPNIRNFYASGDSSPPLGFLG